MRILRVIVTGLALAAAVAAPSAAQTAGTPRFEDYPATVRRGRVAPLDLASHPLARTYRTTFRRQRREEGVNFAGRYTLVSAGCGTGCSIVGIVDARNGRAHFPREMTGWTSIVGDYDFPDGDDGWTYRADSRLLRVVGRARIGALEEERYGPSGIHFYEWTGTRLRQVGFVPVGSYPRADPPERP